MSGARPQHAEAMRRYWARPERRARQAEVMRRLNERADFREAHRAVDRTWKDPARREAQAERMRQRWGTDAVFRARTIEGRRRAWTPDSRRRQGARIQQIWAEYRAFMAELPDRVDELYRRYARELLVRCIDRCRGDLERAQDLLQEVFGLLLEARHHRRAVAVGVLAWLRARIDFGATDAYRRDTKWSRAARAPREVVGDVELQPVASPEPSPARRAELADDVEAALSAFRPIEALLLRLRYLEGLTDAEIGHRIGVDGSRVCQLMTPLLARLGVHRRRVAA